MHIKKLNEKLRNLTEANWDSFASHSLPNGDKDDGYEPTLIDKGTFSINILGTDITYKVTEESYEDPKIQKLFGGIILEIQESDFISDKLNAVIKEKINDELQKVFDNELQTKYKKDPEQIAPIKGGAFISVKIPTKLMCRSK